MTANCSTEIPKRETPLNTLAALQQVNAALRSALLQMQPEQHHCSVITPKDFSNLRGQIQRGAEYVSGLKADSTAIARTEVAAYRGHLEHLQQFLPDLQGRMLAERSRLEAARDQVVATADWVRASQKTM